MLNDMSYIDLVVGILILLFALKGLKSGIIREIFGIIGLIGGLWMAMKFREEAGAWITTNIYDFNKIGVASSAQTETIVGFLGVLFGVWIVCLIIGEIIARLLQLSGIGILDRLGGFVFGGAKVFLVFAALATLLNSMSVFTDKFNPYLEKSKLYPYLSEWGKKIISEPLVQNVKRQITNDDDEPKGERFDPATMPLPAESNATEANTTESNQTE